METYKVIAVRSGRWWALQCPEIRGMYSQGRTLDEAHLMAREAIALMLDVAEDSFTFEIATEWAAALAAVTTEAEAIERRMRKLQETRITLLNEMRNKGVSLRDAAQLLGITRRNAAQLPKQIVAAG